MISGTKHIEETDSKGCDRKVLLYGLKVQMCKQEMNYVVEVYRQWHFLHGFATLAH